MHRRANAAMLALLVIGACTPTVESATFATYPPRPADADIRVYRSQRPACAFEEIGILVWRPVNAWDSLDDGVEDMRRRAREMGGDAILDFSYGEPATGVTTTTSSDSTRVVTTSSVEHERIATGTVIRFSRAGC